MEDPSDPPVQSMHRRTSKVLTFDEAVDMVRPNMLLSFGGVGLHNKPSAIVRKLIARGGSPLDLATSPPSSYDVDLIVGAGLIRRVVTAYCGFEHLGLAPNFRHAVESGHVEAPACDEALILGGFLAAAEGIPYHPVQSMRASDTARESTLIKEYVPPFGDGTLQAVGAIRPDIAFIHAREADEFGNVRFLGFPFMDKIIARAARRVIVTAETIIDHSEVLRAPQKTDIPSMFVYGVVEAPYGAHPCGCPGAYLPDYNHLQMYLSWCKEGEGSGEPNVKKYVDAYVRSVSDHFDYLDLVGGLRRLAALSNADAVSESHHNVRE